MTTTYLYSVLQCSSLLPLVGHFGGYCWLVLLVTTVMVELSINSTPSSHSQRNHMAQVLNLQTFWALGNSWSRYFCCLVLVKVLLLHIFVKVLLLSHFRQGTFAKSFWSRFVQGTFASLELRAGQLLAAKPQGDKAGEQSDRDNWIHIVAVAIVVVGISVVVVVYTVDLRRLLLFSLLLSDDDKRIHIVVVVIILVLVTIVFVGTYLFLGACETIVCW